MAAIRERIDENGQKSYQAKVRIQGYPPRSKTFLRKTDAKKWAVQTETEIRTGMHIRQSQAGRLQARVSKRRSLNSRVSHIPRARLVKERTWSGSPGVTTAKALTWLVVAR